MNPALETLIALQQLDSAAETARRRLNELPAAATALDERIAAAEAALSAVDQRAADNQARRHALEKEVAVIDGRLARFEEHKASVKTNQEYTALLHEIEIARGSKDALEEQILILLEEADMIAAERENARQAVDAAKHEVEAARRELATEQAALEAELGRLAEARQARAAELEPALLYRYEQLLRQRRMIAVAPLDGDVCGACHVRLRPVVTQHVRQNDQIVTCDNCQRILYAPPKADPRPDSDSSNSSAQA